MSPFGTLFFETFDAANGIERTALHDICADQSA
jgi:hypothetical protein